MLRVGGGDRLEDLPDGRVHRLAALDHDRRALAAQDVAVARALGDRDEPRRGVRRLRRGVELRQPPLALGGLAVHVADLDVGCVDDSDRAPDCERVLRLVGVDVHLRNGLVPGDEQRVAERLEAGVDRVEVELGALHHEHGAVAVLGLLVVDRLLGDLLGDDRHLGERLAGQPVEDAAEQLDEPCPARVDDARLAELVEHLRRPLDRVVTACDRPGERLGDRERTHLGQLRLLGHLADDGQHRPLDRHLHGLVRARRSGSDRDGEDLAVDRLVLAEHARHAPHDRAEDDARVPLRLHRRGPLDVCRELGGGLRRRAVELVHDALHRQREVRPGVAVGHRVDVERVDPPAVPLDVLEPGPGERTDRLDRDHSALRALSTWTSTALTTRPVCRSTS